jgi:pimeloyl-ACP methyl ester carboxylesterase
MAAHQQVRFCESFDGARIAWAASGSGPPLLLLPSWLTHLEYQWQSTAWRPWLEALATRHRLIRYDPRGCGLSDGDVADLSFETWVRDVDAVTGAAGLDRFSMIGICQGGAVALTWAGRNRGRLDRLVLYGTYARGRNRRAEPPLEPQKAAVMLRMIELGWGDPDGAFLRSFATQFQPEGGIEHLDSWSRLQRRAAPAETAAALTRVMFDIDVTADAAGIDCPTLVAHPERDAVAPVEEGRLLARLIPQARFLLLDSVNHFLRPNEPAWEVLTAALREFLPQGAPAALAGLTPRETEVLALLARGLNNRAIAGTLGIGEKTVRNHVSSIFAGLGAASRAEAVVIARDHGLGAPEA